jgi:hypothetical protein
MCKMVQFTSDGIVVLALLALPLCWILRDGLGPDAVTSAGLDAIIHTFWTFSIGPILSISVIFSILLRVLCYTNKKNI